MAAAFAGIVDGKFVGTTQRCVIEPSSTWITGGHLYRCCCRRRAMVDYRLCAPASSPSPSAKARRLRADDAKFSPVVEAKTSRRRSGTLKGVASTGSSRVRSSIENKSRRHPDLILLTHILLVVSFAKRHRRRQSTAQHHAVQYSAGEVQKNAWQKVDHRDTADAGDSEPGDAEKKARIAPSGESSRGVRMYDGYHCRRTESRSRRQTTMTR